MKSSFDKVAPIYDTTFTNTEIGKMQRNLVYKQLSKQITSVKRILEINCGTGEDAIWFARQNFIITATDISQKMIEVSRNKGIFDNLSFLTSDIKNINSSFEEKSFDLVFSNFGGLNCLTKNELKKFFTDATLLLADKGKIILVIMPKSTLWEQFYFCIKLEFSNIFRRKKESVLANVDGEKVQTYYYNPKDIVNLSQDNFELVSINPIGFFVPPSYLESFFKNKKAFLRLLNSFEKRISNLSFLSKYADHYIITLQKR